MNEVQFINIIFAIGFIFFFIVCVGLVVIFPESGVRK